MGRSFLVFLASQGADVHLLKTGITIFKEKKESSKIRVLGAVT